jgi:hypothetical protein
MLNEMDGWQIVDRNCGNGNSGKRGRSEQNGNRTTVGVVELAAA